jgi:hypothetical protein
MPTGMSNQTTESAQGGVPTGSGLRRPTFFDGQFLRAGLLTAEQSYLNSALLQTQLAGGPGVAYGLNVTLNGTKLTVTPGLGFTSSRMVYLPESKVVELADLLATWTTGSHTVADGLLLPPASRAFASAVIGADQATFYLLQLCPASSTVGQTEVLGLRCQEGCTSVLGESYIREEAVLSLRPLILTGGLPGDESMSPRSRLASGYFRDEDGRAAGQLGNHPLLDGWCTGAELQDTDCLSIGVLIKAGDRWEVDAWIVRRERIETPAKRHWHRRMGMRPYESYLAQILQFQCQLRDALEYQMSKQDEPSLAPEVLEQAVKKFINDNEVLPEQDRLAIATQFFAFVRSRRSQIAPYGVQIDATPHPLRSLGFLDLPPAGFLPLASGYDGSTDAQVQAWFDDLPLEFVAVREDEVGDAIESAQHRDRISLTADVSSERRPMATILIPNGVASTNSSPQWQTDAGFVVFVAPQHVVASVG